MRRCGYGHANGYGHGDRGTPNERVSGEMTNERRGHENGLHSQCLESRALAIRSHWPRGREVVHSGSECGRDCGYGYVCDHWIWVKERGPHLMTAPSTLLGSMDRRLRQ